MVQKAKAQARAGKAGQKKAHQTAAEGKSPVKAPEGGAKSKSRGRPSRRDGEATMERIISVATRVFAAKGFEGASIKEICREANVNMAAIHYHFETKENLYRSIIAKFGSQSIESAVRALQPVSSLEELKTRLNIFLSESIANAAEHPDVALMIIRDVQTHVELLADIFEKSFGRSHEALERFFKSAQESGVIDPSISIPMAVGSLQAHLHFLIGNRRLFKLRFGFEIDDPVHRQEWVRKVIEIYVNGVRNRS